MNIIKTYSDCFFEISIIKLIKLILMRKIKKIALMMGNNSFIGREYASNLITNNINFEIYFWKLNNNIEKNRTKGFWKPLSQSKILKKENLIF